MTSTTLSASALAILRGASARGFLAGDSGGVKGGPAIQVRKGLARDGLIELTDPPALEQVTLFLNDFKVGAPGLAIKVTAEGRRAAGLPAEVEAPASDTSGEGPVNAPPAAAPKAGSKTQQMVDLLKRPEGASLSELQAALGWLPHTTRASISTAAKKGLIAKPETVKEDGRGRVYRVAA